MREILFIAMFFFIFLVSSYSRSIEFKDVANNIFESKCRFFLYDGYSRKEAIAASSYSENCANSYYSTLVYGRYLDGKSVVEYYSILIVSSKLKLAEKLFDERKGDLSEWELALIIEELCLNKLNKKNALEFSVNKYPTLENYQFRYCE